MAITERNSSKILWGIIGLLILIVAGAFAYFNFSTSDAENTPNITTPASEVIATSEPAPAASDVILTEANTSTLISEDVLKEAVPENASLAKEEVAKLNDIQNQLKDQEALLKEQHADADQLIELKEEQIKLLEAQLAESQ